MKLLIVEDDEHLLAGLLRSLRQTGYDIITAHNAEEGLERVEDADVMLTDIRMPGMNGIDLLREVRKQHPHIETIRHDRLWDHFIGHRSHETRSTSLSAETI